MRNRYRQTPLYLELYSAAGLIIVLIILSAKPSRHSGPGQFETFEKIEMLVATAIMIREISVRVRFGPRAMVIESLEGGSESRVH